MARIGKEESRNIATNLLLPDYNKKQKECDVIINKIIITAIESAIPDEIKNIDESYQCYLKKSNTVEVKSKLFKTHDLKLTKSYSYISNGYDKVYLEKEYIFKDSYNIIINDDNRKELYKISDSDFELLIKSLYDKNVNELIYKNDVADLARYISMDLRTHKRCLEELPKSGEFFYGNFKRVTDATKNIDKILNNIKK